MWRACNTKVAIVSGLVIAIVVSNSVKSLEVIGGYCCDGQSIARCQVWPFRPVGEPCWCPGTGTWSGQVCL